ncbi:MAG: MerR family transcriptional regulator [Nevskiales bacterium]
MAKTDEALTIEELSFRSGVTTRNIRAYQSRGLIPPPDPQPGERIGYYGAGHVARLRLINRLQERGFSLAGIADLLVAWEDGRSLDQVLGMESAVADSRPDDSVVIPEATLRQMTPPGIDPEDLLRRLRALGLLVREGQQYRLRHPSILQLGMRAAGAGIPIEQLLAEFERIQKDAHRIARRFVKLYNAFVWLPYKDAGMPSERLPEITQGMKLLRQMAVEITHPLMADALTDEIEAIAIQNLPTPETLARQTQASRSEE